MEEYVLIGSNGTGDRGMLHEVFRSSQPCTCEFPNIMLYHTALITVIPVSFPIPSAWFPFWFSHFHLTLCKNFHRFYSFMKRLRVLNSIK